MYAVNDLGHVFTIVHICCFWIEYLKAETIQEDPGGVGLVLIKTIAFQHNGTSISTVLDISTNRRLSFM